MLSLFSNIKTEFSRGLDEAQLIEIKKNVRNANKEKIIEYSKEIHYIMQRHFTNQNILTQCKDTLKYIEDVIKIRDEIEDVKLYGYSNTVIIKNFKTKWY